MQILNVLPHSIAGRLIMASIADGFIELGHEVINFDELKDEPLPSGNFDYIIGYDFSGLKIKVDNNLAYKSITYFSDVIQSTTSGPEWQKYEPYLKDSFNFYWDEELCKSEPYMIYMPHFLNCEVYKNLSLEPEYDVMFAGRLDTDKRLNMFLDLAESLPEVRFAWYAIQKHYDDAYSRCHNELLTEAYKGFIDNEVDMAIAINKTKIAYNINAQGKGSLNYRTFQTTACEKLMISDYRDELKLFDGNMPYYDDTEDLKAKILYYLDNKIEYNRIVKACREITEKYHNSKVCVENMLSKINR